MGTGESSQEDINKMKGAKRAGAQGSRTLSHMGTGAALGATIGSVIPGLGTLIGAGVGGGIGAVVSLYKYLSSDKAATKAEETVTGLTLAVSKMNDAAPRLEDNNLVNALTAIRVESTGGVMAMQKAQKVAKDLSKTTIPVTPVAAAATVDKKQGIAASTAARQKEMNARRGGIRDVVKAAKEAGVSPAKYMGMIKRGEVGDPRATAKDKVGPPATAARPAGTPPATAADLASTEATGKVEYITGTMGTLFFNDALKEKNRAMKQNIAATEKEAQLMKYEASQKMKILVKRAAKGEGGIAEGSGELFFLSDDNPEKAKLLKIQAQIDADAVGMVKESEDKQLKFLNEMKNNEKLQDALRKNWDAKQQKIADAKEMAKLDAEFGGDGDDTEAPRAKREKSIRATVSKIKPNAADLKRMGDEAAGGPPKKSWWSRTMPSWLGGDPEAKAGGDLPAAEKQGDKTAAAVIAALRANAPKFYKEQAILYNKELAIMGEGGVLKALEEVGGDAELLSPEMRAQYDKAGGLRALRDKRNEGAAGWQRTLMKADIKDSYKAPNQNAVNPISPKQDGQAGDQPPSAEAAMKAIANADDGPNKSLGVNVHNIEELASNLEQSTAKMTASATDAKMRAGLLRTQADNAEKHGDTIGGSALKGVASVVSPSALKDIARRRKEADELDPGGTYRAKPDLPSSAEEDAFLREAFGDIQDIHNISELKASGIWSGQKTKTKMEDGTRRVDYEGGGHKISGARGTEYFDAEGNKRAYMTPLIGGLQNREFFSSDGARVNATMAYRGKMRNPIGKDGKPGLMTAVSLRGKMSKEALANHDARMAGRNVPYPNLDMEGMMDRTGAFDYKVSAGAVSTTAGKTRAGREYYGVKFDAAGMGGKSKRTFGFKMKEGETGSLEDRKIQFTAGDGYGESISKAYDAKEFAKGEGLMQTGNFPSVNAPQIQTDNSVHNTHMGRAKSTTNDPRMQGRRMAN